MTQRLPARRLLPWLFAATCALSACGGGGGDGGGDASPPPPTGGAPAPNPVPAPAPEPAPPTPAGVSGHLWHDNYALDTVDGTQIASPTGEAPVTVLSGDDAAVPWSDGQQYVTYDWDIGANVSNVKIVNVNSKQVLSDIPVPGYFRSVKPSPANKDIILGMQSDSTVGPADTIVIDTASATVLQRFFADGPVDWLPDGRYLRVANGALIAGRVDGTPGQPQEETVGDIQPPDGRVVEGLWVNRQANKLALRLKLPSSPLAEYDIWLANMDGSGLERFTSTKISADARWSPDGNYVAFDVDTGSTCNAVGCVGQCELWYAPVTSRNVSALPAANDASPFRVRNSRGDVETLGCGLIAWTD